jgi:hypothetical protein
VGDFNRCFKNYRTFCLAIQWRRVPLSLQGQAREVRARPPKDLLEADMGAIICKIKAADPSRKKFGCLPYMATCSRGSIVSSFAERINSGTNFVLAKGNTLLSSEEINVLVVLRMNCEFMKYTRTSTAAASR